MAKRRVNAQRATTLQRVDHLEERVRKLGLAVNEKLKQTEDRRVITQDETGQVLEALTDRVEALQRGLTVLLEEVRAPLWRRLWWKWTGEKWAKARAADHGHKVSLQAEPVHLKLSAKIAQRIRKMEGAPSEAGPK